MCCEAPLRLCIHQCSQTRIKETHWAVRKEFLSSTVSFISCHITVEQGMSCIKADE